MRIQVAFSRFLLAWALLLFCSSIVSNVAQASSSFCDSFVFTGYVNQKNDSSKQSFNVPAGTDYILVTLTMCEDTDFDLSLWDNQGRRTGGWTSTQSEKRYKIPNSRYSGYSNYSHRIREWITVKPPATSGTWEVACYSFTGSDQYTIRVELRDGYVEDGKKELGIEWINDYSPGKKSDDLQHSDDSARDFRDKLCGEGWTKKYEWSNSSVYECDFKSNLYPTGREDTNETDTVDIVLYCGHGTEGQYGDPDACWMNYSGAGPYISNGVHDDAIVEPIDAYMSWGDQDLEWIGFDSCRTLKYPWEWAQAMNGLHLICGFSNDYGQNCLLGSFNNLGGKWADKMVDDDPADDWYWNWDEEMTVKQAWFEAADELVTWPHSANARVIGETSGCGNDYLWGQGSFCSDPVHDDTYKQWDHSCSSTAEFRPAEGQSSIMLYKVRPLEITEEYVRRIGEVLGLAGYVHAQEEDGCIYFYMADEKKTLKISEMGGIYYMDTSKLWISVDRPPELPTKEEARGIAERFLAGNDLMPMDAVFGDVNTDTEIEAYSVMPIERDGKASVSSPTEEDHIISRVETNYVVEFVRYIDAEGYGVGNSKLKVYVGQRGDIIGLQKVWREIEQDIEVPLIPANEALELLRSFGSRVTPITIPIFDDFVNIRPSLGYYEHCDGAKQEYLMPVYRFDGDFVRGEAVTPGAVVIAAVESFLPPVPQIASPVDRAEFTEEEAISFQGTASYGTPPYAFVWESDIVGLIGSGSSVTANLTAAHRDSVCIPHTITLTVTDSKGSSKEDMIAITVVPVIKEPSG